MTDSTSPDSGDKAPPPADRAPWRRMGAGARRAFGRVLMPLRPLARMMAPMLSSVEEARKFIVNFSIVTGVIVGVYVIVKASSRDYVTIDAIAVPTSLAERGFTGEVIAQRMHDEITEIGRRSKANTPIGQFSTFSFERTLPKIDLPIGGMSLASVVASLRDFIGITDTKIAGEVTISDAAAGQKKKYALRLRISQRGAVYSEDDPTENLDDLIRRAAMNVVERFNPHIAAAYYYNEKNYDRALQMVHQSLTDRNRDNDAEALNLRGMIAQKQERYDAALATFEDVSRRFPKDPRALRHLADTFNLKGDHVKALAKARASITLDTKQAAAYLSAGSALFAMGRYDDALKEFQNSVDRDPSSVGYFTLATSYLALPKPNEELALSLFQRAIDADPRDERNYLKFGELIRKRGAFREAKALFEKAIDANPNSPSGFQGLGLVLLDEYNCRKAEENLRRANNLDSDSPYIWHDLGRALLCDGKYDEAADLFRQAIAEDPKFALGHIKLAAALAELVRQARRDATPDDDRGNDDSAGQIEAMRSDIDELIARAAALGLSNAQGEILRDTGRIYEVLERHPEAAETYRKAIAADEKRNSGLQIDIDRLARRIAGL